MDANDEQTRAVSGRRPTRAQVDLEAQHASLHGLWLAFARACWMLVALFSVGSFAASVPPYYARARASSVRNVPTSDAMKAGLEQLSIPYEAYTFYWVAVLVVLAAVFFVVGAMIFWRRSDDPVALFFSGTLIAFGAIWPDTLDTLKGINPVLDFAGTALSSFGFAAFFLMLYLFPDGRFVPRWTRWIALWFAIGVTLDTFFPGSVLDAETWPSPFDLLDQAEALAFIGTMVYAQIYRYRRVSTPLQRQQTKWVVFSLIVAVACFIGTASLEGLPAFNRPGVPAALFGFLTSITYGFAFMLVPIAVGAAVLRRRLWDIDPVVNRVLVYGILTAGVVGLYVLVVGYLGALFRTGENLLFSLIAAGIVAVLFQPLRERVQRTIDRLMYGERDEPYVVVSRLGERLEATLAPDAVLPTIASTVREALRLPYVAVALPQDGGSEIAAASGEPSTDPFRLPLYYQGETVGELLLGVRAPGEEFSAADRRLLNDLAHHAGVAVHGVRVMADLRRSRERLVLAREEERRRLRRDLHDELAPTLAALGLTAATVGELIPTDPKGAATLNGELQTEIRTTVGEVRRLVYDLRPPTLDELGLTEAIRQRAARYNASEESDGLKITVEASGLPRELPAAVEVAAYRIVQEALMNVVRHAGAGTCAVRLACPEGRTLEVEVVDDGIGMPGSPEFGVGLRSMQERATELGGGCRVERAAPAGTRVFARLPLAEPVGVGDKEG